MTIGDKVVVTSNGIKVGIGRIQAIRGEIIVVTLGRDGKHKFSADGNYGFLPREVAPIQEQKEIL